MIGIDPDLDGLYDPQQRPPAGWCPACGREIYAYGENLCTRCREWETAAGRSGTAAGKTGRKPLTGKDVKRNG